MTCFLTLVSNHTTITNKNITTKTSTTTITTLLRMLLLSIKNNTNIIMASITTDTRRIITIRAINLTVLSSKRILILIQTALAMPSKSTRVRLMTTPSCFGKMISHFTRDQDLTPTTAPSTKPKTGRAFRCAPNLGNAEAKEPVTSRDNVQAKMAAR